MFSDHYSKNAYQRTGYKAVILQKPIEHVLDVNVPYILRGLFENNKNKKKLIGSTHELLIKNNSCNNYLSDFLTFLSLSVRCSTGLVYLVYLGGE